MGTKSKQAKKSTSKNNKAKAVVKKVASVKKKPEKKVVAKHHSPSTAKSSKPVKKEPHVSLSKLGKAKIRPKGVIAPRKIEKIIDISQLEKKLADIMSMDHTEFSVEEKLKALYVLQQIDSNVDKIRT